MAQSWQYTTSAADVPGQARAGASRGARLGLELILATARARAPHEEGDLERSGAASTVRDSGGHVGGTVSFDTPYAVRQHEDMTLRHDDGRQAKYLETAMGDEADTVARLAQQQIRNALGT